MKDSVKRFDQAVTSFITNSFGPASRPFFKFMTALGDPITISLVTVIIGIFGLAHQNIQLVVAAAVIPVTVLVGALLKLLFERARPTTEYAMRMKIQTFSFPSGHSSGSLIAYGVIAHIAFSQLLAPLNIAATIVLGMIPIFVGVSRVYLGAHFPSDVIAGWSLSAAALLIVIFLVHPLT